MRKPAFCQTLLKAKSIGWRDVNRRQGFFSGEAEADGGGARERLERTRTGRRRDSEATEAMLSGWNPGAKTRNSIGSVAQSSWKQAIQGSSSITREGVHAQPEDGSGSRLLST